MQKVTPFLMFNNQTDEAVNFYVAVIPNSRIVSATRYGPGGPGPEGKIMSATCVVGGQEIMAYDGGPHFKFTDGFSLFVHCETQEEVDELWSQLSAGGQEVQCGWLTDRFGVSWQIVPNALMQYLSDPDPRKAQNVMQAMLQMVKLDIAGLKRAYEQA
jgi:predicted 3-demethylubiquinone-9 3-methyltransferase (glyoxalase superfamily)